MKQQKGNVAILIPVIAVIAVAIGILVQSMQNRAPLPSEMPEFKSTIILPKAKNIQLPTLVDHNDTLVDDDRLAGKWSMLFFGFTNCPDICPTTLQTLAQAKRTLTEQGVWENFQVFMITVDPERDTQQQLANYVPYFDAEFLGVSSPLEQLEIFAKQLGILFIKRDADEQGRYEVDHSAAIILLNPQGQYAGVISAPHTAQDIADDMLELALYEELPISPKVANIEQPQNNSIITRTEQSLQIENAWIRAAPPGVSSMAAYFTLNNVSDIDIEIVDSTSPVFGNTMLHDTTIEDGMAQMNHLDSLTIPAQGKRVLKPMGTHMMLMMPKAPLNEGDRVSIELIDSEETRYPFEVEVRASAE